MVMLNLQKDHSHQTSNNTFSNSHKNINFNSSSNNSISSNHNNNINSSSNIMLNMIPSLNFQITKTILKISYLLNTLNLKM